jgi:putative dimethyl sulfoxide reductase chaperone
MKGTESKIKASSKASARRQGLNLAEAADRLAATFTTLARLHTDAPTPLLVESLRKSPRLQSGLMAGGEVSLGMEGMSGYIETTRSNPSDEVALELAVDWNRLFRGVSQSAGPPPPVEALYAGAEDDSLFLRELNRIYSEQGLELRGDFLDRPDHLGVELTFIADLFRRAAAAIQDDEQERAAGILAAAGHFFTAHPGKWVSTFCDGAIPYARTDFYRGLLQLTRGVVRELDGAWDFTG